MDERRLRTDEELRLLRRGILDKKHFDSLQSRENNIATSTTAVEALFLHKNYVALLEEKFGTDHRDTIAAIANMDAYIDTIPVDDRICVYDVVKSTVGVNGVYSTAYNRIIEETTTEVNNLDWKISNKGRYSIAMRTLGIIRMNQGYFELAENHFKASLSTSKELQVEKPMLMLQTMNDLAVLYSKIGKYKEALDLFTECLNVWSKLLNRNYPNTISSIDSSESVFRNSVIHEEALRLYTKWLALRAEEKHPYVVTLKSNMAVLKMNMGNYKEALVHFTYCLGCRNDVLGDCHPDTLATMNNLAELYDMIGEHSKAKDLYEKSLNASLLILEENYPLTERFMGNLDKLTKNAKRYKESLPLFTDHMSLREAVLGTTHVDAHQSMNGLRELFRKKMGGNAKQIPPHTDGHELLENVGESEELSTFSFRDSETGYSMSPSPIVPKSSEEVIHENENFLSRSNLENNILWLALVEEALRMKGLDPLTMVNNVAYLYMKLGKYDLALPLFTNCLAMREEVLGKKHPDTLQSIRNLAVLLKCMGKYYDALPLYVKHSLLMETLFGCKHPYCIEINNDLTLLYIEVGEYEKALCIYKEKLLPQNIPLLNNEDLHHKNGSYLFTELFGHNHPSCLDIQHYISTLHNKIGGFDDAISGNQKKSAIQDISSLTNEDLRDRNSGSQKSFFSRWRNKLKYSTPTSDTQWQRTSSVTNDNSRDVNSDTQKSFFSRWRNKLKYSVSMSDTHSQLTASVNKEDSRSRKVDEDLTKLRYGFKYILFSSDERSKHTSYVNAVCCTGKYIVSASDDRRILVWVVTNDGIEFRYELRGHTGPIVCLHVIQDENLNVLNHILSASHDGTIKHWDLNKGVCVQSIAYNDNSVNECLAVTCNGKYIFKGVKNGNVGMMKGLIHIFDMKHGGFLYELAGHTDNVCCFAITSHYLFSGSLDMSIGRLDLESVTRLCSERFSQLTSTRARAEDITKVTFVKLIGHTDWVRSLCCTKDESRLIIICL